MSEIRVSARYARSLFVLAEEQKQLDGIYAEAEQFLNAIKDNKDLGTLLKSPVIGGDVKLKVVAKILAKTSDLFKSFIKIVVRKGRDFLLRDIMEQFIAMYREHRNLLTAKVTTAVPIKDKVLKEIKKHIEKRTGATVDLSVKVDPSIMGGFVVRYSDKLIDASVSTQLKNLREQLLAAN